MSLSAIAAFGGEMKGVISDSHCGGKHTAGSDADRKCVQTCIKGGGQPVFVSEGKVLKIADPSKISEEHYGRKVVVNGSVSGDTLTVESVKADTTS
jgi:hypothetical protein